MPSVIVRQDGQVVATVTLQGDTFYLGRQNDCQVIIKDVLSSRQHAKIQKTPEGGFALEDLGSHNGTFLNGQKIERENLNDEDEIQIGSHTITFYVADEPPSTATAAESVTADVTGRGVATFDEGAGDELGDMLRGMLDKAKQSQGTPSDKTLPQGTQPAQLPPEAAAEGESEAAPATTPAPAPAAASGISSKMLLMIVGGVILLIIIVVLALFLPSWLK